LPAHLHADRSQSMRVCHAVRGSAMIELALYMSFAVPMLCGLTSVGVRLGRSILAIQVTRDTGHMYALGADFTLSGTQAIAQTLAGGFSLTSNGTAVLIFSRVTKVQQVDCTAAGLPNCPNLNQAVFTQQVVVGNSTLRSSNFGTPSSTYVGSKGMITSSNYCKQSSLIANGFEVVLSLQPGQASWMVEGYFIMPELNIFSAPNRGGVYERLLF
jgi:hypothetical protein